MTLSSIDSATALDRVARRMVLGTAQLAMNYGIANRTGPPSFDEAVDLVRKAWEGGIRSFDTAQAYGCSETVLGQALAAIGAGQQARIISKLDGSVNPVDAAQICQAAEASRSRLGVRQLYGLMLHREQALDMAGTGLCTALNTVLKKGLARHVGVSVYSPEAALKALDLGPVTMIQLPANLLDRRFEEAGVFAAASRMRKRVYIRSIYLQGLLLLSPDRLPEGMSFAGPLLCAARELANRMKISIEALALAYVIRQYPDAAVVFGAETAAQVVQNLDMAGTALPREMVAAIRSELYCNNPQLLNPGLWPVNQQSADA